MSKDKYYIYELKPRLRYKYSYRINVCYSLVESVNLILKSYLQDKLNEIGAYIASSDNHEVSTDTNIEVEELADILYEIGASRASIKQTENKAYSLRERG